MSHPEKDALQARFDELSRRIEANIAEYRNSGEPSKDQESYADFLRGRQTEIGRKLSAAAREGDAWNTIKHEIDLDISELMEHCQKWEDQFDASRK